MENVTIRVKVEERSTKDGSKKFNVFKTFSKNGVIMDLKFRADVKPIPKEDCLIVVPIDKINKQKNTQYPCVWVSEVLEIKQLETFDAEKNRKEIVDLFGEAATE